MTGCDLSANPILQAEAPCYRSLGEAMPHPVLYNYADNAPVRQRSVDGNQSAAC
jgi:hypothetical protein